MDAFEKVEKVFMLGLRASDPAKRAAFFQLFHNAIPATLYDRLKYIVLVQDWEHLSSSFWLKQALVSTNQWWG